MTKEALEFAPILRTDRLTLTLMDFTNQADVETFTTLLKSMVGDLLHLTDQEATSNAQATLDFNLSPRSRIQPALFPGRNRKAPDKPAVWLVRLGTVSPHGERIGVVYVLQRTLMPDQSWIISPEHRGRGYATEAAGEVLRYLRDDLGLRDLMAIVHPDSPKSSHVACRIGYEPVEGGLMYEDGVTRLLVFALPSARPLPKGLVFSRFGGPE